MLCIEALCRLRCSTPASVSSQQLFRFHLERCGRPTRPVVYHRAMAAPTRLVDADDFINKVALGQLDHISRLLNGRTSRPDIARYYTSADNIAPCTAI